MRSRIKYNNNLLPKHHNNNYIIDDFYEEINDINNNSINNDINKAKNISVNSYFLFVILYYIWIFLI
jgi:hypothetical protein